MHFYSQNVTDVLSEQGVDKSKGLSDDEVNIRFKKFGFNELKQKKIINPIILFLSQFNSFIIYILFFALFISIILKEYVDATVILIILLFNAILGFIQEYKAEKAIDALKKLSGLKVKVLRNGEVNIIDAKELVPGDIMFVEEGNKVSADARIIEQSSLYVSEAALTGESVPVSKISTMIKNASSKIASKKINLAEQKNMLFSGTIVTRGRGKTVVIGTGMNREIGKIADMLSETEKVVTPLQKKLDILGKKIVWITLALCALVFFVGVLSSPEISLLFQGKIIEFILSINQWFLTAISLAVAAVPEGLPAVVTIALAIGVKKMLNRNALVRRLQSVETLGETTVICTDKTGTLTMNEMTVKIAYTYDNPLIMETTDFSRLTKQEELLFNIGIICNDSDIKKQDEFVGDPTETALMKSAKTVGISPFKIKSSFIRVKENPFDSVRKMMSTVIIDSKSKNEYVYAKGAPEKIIEKCTHILIGSKKIKMTPKEKKKLLSINDNYASKALRMLAFAYKQNSKGHTEEGLIFVGLQGMMDPPRKEVANAIKKCKLAGIRVLMLTGDNGLTAKGIASEIGIVGDWMKGSEFEKLNHDEKLKVIETTSIFSRVEPSHKMEIVKILQEKGEIVSMTGDGVNDAPAIKKADIGIAMGITGTDVTKESSDIILQDDNFTTIVNAIEEGRGIYANIKRFVNYLLSSNMAEVLFILVAILLKLPLPMTAIMILFLNLVTDGLPALALSMDPNPTDLMNMPPKKKSEQIMDKNMIFNIALVSVLIVTFGLGIFVIALGYYSFLPEIEQLAKIQTIAFTSLVLMELVRLQAIRSEFKLKMFSNKWLVIAVATSIGLQLAVIYTPLSQFFGTVPLTFFDWGLLIGATIAVSLCRQIIIRIPLVRKTFYTYD